MLFVDNEMSSPTPLESDTMQTTDVVDCDDENGAAAGTLNMVVEKNDVVMNKAGFMPREDEDDKTANNDSALSDVNESSDIGRPNRYLDVKNKWEMFRTPAFYNNDDGGESDLMVVQGPLFNRLTIKERSIDTRGYPSRLDRFLVLAHAVRV